MKSKAWLLAILLLFPVAAHAMDCTSKKAITQAKAAFADGLASPDAFQLEHVVEGTLGAMPVCEGIFDMDGESQPVVWVNNDDGSITQFQQDDQGNITTSNLAPNGAQSQLQAIQALGEQQAKQFDQGQADQQKQADQAAYDRTSQQWAEDKPKCDQIEQHPVGSGLLGILVGHGSSGLTLAKCQQLQTLMAQMNQQAAQEGLTMNNQGGNQ